MQSRKLIPSAATITWGVLLLVVGQVLYDYARQAAIQAALSPFGGSGAGPVGPLGMLTALLGLIFLVIGVYRLATNVDIAAEAAIATLGGKSPAAPQKTADAADEASTPVPVRDVLPPARTRPTTGP